MTKDEYFKRLDMQAVAAACGTLTARGYKLHSVPDGWDVELPDGSWRACNCNQDLFNLAGEAVNS